MVVNLLRLNLKGVASGVENEHNHLSRSIAMRSSAALMCMLASIPSILVFVFRLALLAGWSIIEARGNISSCHPPGNCLFMTSRAWTSTPFLVNAWTTLQNNQIWCGTFSRAMTHHHAFSHSDNNLPPSRNRTPLNPISIAKQPNER